MNELNRAVDLVRRDAPEDAEARAAAERVRTKLNTTLNTTGGENTLCSGFRAEFAAQRAGTLGEGRRMLLEDHLNSCVACRREHAGAPAAPVFVMPRRNVMTRRWALATAAALVLAGLSYALPPVLDRALAPDGPRGTVASIQGSLVAVSGEGVMPLAVGAEIGEGQEVRTGRDSHAMLRLRDGSMVEMHERTSLDLNERWRGKTIHLARGNVIVQAAKQKSGRLEVATNDALVSVKGTIFEVSMGLQGSRVSVVEGSVQVDETSGGGVLLQRGQQKVTNSTMGRTAVVEEVAWSQNAAKYIALLADLRSASEEISRIPMPGLRYSSRLLDRMPASSVVVISVPNLSQVLGEADRILENKASQSAGMSEWWNKSGVQEFRKAMVRIRTISEYLGEEILIGIPKDGAPIILAETVKAGLANVLQGEGPQIPVAFEGIVVAIGATAVPPPGTFTHSGFGLRVADAYRDGAGILFAANLEQIVAGNVDSSKAGLDSVGFDNIKYLVAEHKGSLASPVQTATLTFQGARKGLASWLAAPGPMGSLEFVSPEASFAASFVMRDPRAFLEELIATKFLKSEEADTLRRETGVSLLDDLAGSMGGEVMVALDGGLLPIPEWRAAVEMENAERFQWALDRLISSAQRLNPENAVAITKEDVDNRTYYKVTGTPMAVHYTYVDGYWLIGSSRAVLMKSISDRNAALTLARSGEFRAQLPADGPGFFSGLLYYNLGSIMGPVADQLKTSGMLTPELQSQVSTITSNRAPGLVFVYGEPDNIRVGSRSNLFQMGFEAVAGMLAGNPLAGVPMDAAGGTQ